MKDNNNVPGTVVGMKKRSTGPAMVLRLEVERDRDKLKVSASEHMAGEASTVRHYEEISAPMEEINARCNEIVETLNKANRKGRVTMDVLKKLRDIGRVFTDDLFTPAVKEKIKSTAAEHLIISIDDQLVHIPWELLHDGRQFLCQKFSMGRLVRTRQTIIGSHRSRTLAKPLKMLIAADPKGDLKGAYEEGTQIRDFLDREKDTVNASLMSENITTDYMREKLRNFDFVHFAGHYDYHAHKPEDSGWRLSDGIFKAEEIIKMIGTGTMPALIFSNACQSARTEEWDLNENFQNKVFGLANAFVLSGVRHSVGTFWEILDDPSRRFALEFYKYVLAGYSVGEAMREARLVLINEYGEETIVWASYMLYGDPTYNYMEQIQTAGVPEHQEKGTSTVTMPRARVRAKEDVIDFSEKESRINGRSRKPRKSAVAAGIVILALLGVLGYNILAPPDTSEFEAAALDYYNAGSYDEAVNTSRLIEDKNPDVRLAYLIRGDVFFRKGQLTEAREAYEKALKAPQGTDLQKAKAFIGLGRVASIAKQPDSAMTYYQKATDTAPGSGQGYLSQAMILENTGRYDKAAVLLAKAEKYSPDDPLVAAAARAALKKSELAADKARQERIDGLVQDLLDKMKSAPRAKATDGWTSPPLSIWIMDFKTMGYSLQEGEDKLFVTGIADRIIQDGRCKVVERDLLDKLLEELNIGSSKLADTTTALSVGKIMAARLIIDGTVVYSGPQTQVSMKLIETETSEIRASVNETFGSSTPAAVLSEKLADVLLNKLAADYPLRGKIKEINRREVKLNIGMDHGVKTGQAFRVIEDDGELEIIAVETETSLAKIVDKGKHLAEGFRVEEVNK